MIGVEKKSCRKTTSSERDGDGDGVGRLGGCTGVNVALICNPTFLVTLGIFVTFPSPFFASASFTLLTTSFKSDI